MSYLVRAFRGTLTRRTNINFTKELYINAAIFSSLAVGGLPGKIRCVINHMIRYIRVKIMNGGKFPVFNHCDADGAMVALEM